MSHDEHEVAFIEPEVVVFIAFRRVDVGLSSIVVCRRVLVAHGKKTNLQINRGLPRALKQRKMGTAKRAGGIDR